MSTQNGFETIKILDVELDSRSQVSLNTLSVTTNNNDLCLFKYVT